ncbi:uncharacterized protein METZ01_LOCUS355163, partial [marine metagenome]
HRRRPGPVDRPDLGGHHQDHPTTRRPRPGPTGGRPRRRPPHPDRRHCRRPPSGRRRGDRSGRPPGLRPRPTGRRSADRPARRTPATLLCPRVATRRRRAHHRGL